jgi:hypothetical protein
MQATRADVTLRYAPDELAIEVVTMAGSAAVGNGSGAGSSASQAVKIYGGK